MGEFIPSKAIKYREDAERAMREFENADLDGVMVVMLTYGPAMRVARLLAESRLPVLLANIQPEPNVTPAWDMADMTYNQGVHGAQDTANAMVRAGKRFAVLTDDWKSEQFRADVGRWARAAAAVTGVEVAQDGDLRLRHERHGRHPGGRERADPRRSARRSSRSRRVTCTGACRRSPTRRWPR